MLQQTQVNTVIDYFLRFMASFPTLKSLANASQDQVLHLWTGLGYYSRARNLHSAARLVVKNHHGKLPNNVEKLCELPGIGVSTAGAILSLAMNTRATILDGNVKRVLCRYHCVSGWPERGAIKKQLWTLAESHTPRKNFDHYTQAIMDLGATLCTRSKPNCQQCPLSQSCEAFASNTVLQFPTRKPKKSLPTKDTHMYMCINKHNEVLLQKRPPVGVWASLWSFPEHSELLDNVANSWGLGLTIENNLTQWKTIKHTFSHFHLQIVPVEIRVTGQEEGIMDSDRWLWYPLTHIKNHQENRALEVGLAAPVKKLITELAQQIEQSD